MTRLATAKGKTENLLSQLKEKKNALAMALKVYNDAKASAERLNRMTEKLLSLTRAEDVTGQQDMEIIFMAPTVRRVARMLKNNALQAGITFDLQLDNDSSILILEDDLYQIVFNLMENGIKYNHSGGRLTVRLRREEDNAILEVSDTGMGIPEEAIDHVFERFYRVDKARSRQTGGSGLGLAIVRSIVQRNRGPVHGLHGLHEVGREVAVEIVVEEAVGHTEQQHALLEADVLQGLEPRAELLGRHGGSQHVEALQPGGWGGGAHSGVRIKACGGRAGSPRALWTAKVILFSGLEKCGGDKKAPVPVARPRGEEGVPQAPDG